MGLGGREERGLWMLSLCSFFFSSTDKGSEKQMMFFLNHKKGEPLGKGFRDSGEGSALLPAVQGF